MYGDMYKWNINLNYQYNSTRWYICIPVKEVIEINAQVASGGKVPTKPGGCNRRHIPKALEHPTGLPNPQPSHEPPAPSSLQAPVTLKPDGIGGKEKKNR